VSSHCQRFELLVCILDHFEAIFAFLRLTTEVFCDFPEEDESAVKQGLALLLVKVFVFFDAAA